MVSVCDPRNRPGEPEQPDAEKTPDNVLASGNAGLVPRAMLSDPAEQPPSDRAKSWYHEARMALKDAMSSWSAWLKLTVFAVVIFAMALGAARLLGLDVDIGPIHIRSHP